MLYIGIDPGIEGSVALMVDRGYKYPSIYLHDVPTTKKDGKRQYDTRAMYETLSQHRLWDREKIVIVEDVHAMPNQGVCSCFNFGRGLGLWEGILAALDWEPQFVAPSVWKKLLMPDAPKEKSASVEVAKKLFPEAAHLMKRVKDHNRADAMLLAEYGRRTYRP